MSNNTTNVNQHSVEERPWTDGQTLYELYVEQELGAPEVADQLGCGKKTIYRWLDKHDIETRKQSVPTELKSEEKLHHLYWEKGLSTNEIADILDCGNTTVFRWMEKHDIPRRNVGGCANAPWRDESLLRELYHDKEFSTEEIANRLGTYRSTILYWLQKYDIDTRDETLGLKDFTDVTGNDHPAWQGGYSQPYNSQWRSVRVDVLERDGYECRACGMSNTEHEDVYGTALEVHHIVPIREYEDPKEAHDLGNLVAACKICHNEFEGLPVFPV